MSFIRKKFRLSAIITGSLIVLMVVLSVTGSIPGLGAPNIEKPSEEEIASFVQVNHRMFTVQSELEERMIKAIEESGLTVEQYVEIVFAQQNPEFAASASEEEMEKVRNVNEKIEALNSELHSTSLIVIAEAGLTVQRYEEIATVLESSKSAQAQYNELMNELMQGHHDDKEEENIG